MRRAGPAILLSAAGLTWLLHAQGVIDGASSAGTTSSATSSQTTTPSTTTTQPPTGPDGGFDPNGSDGFGGGPDDGFNGGPGSGGGATTTTTPSTASGATTDGPVEQTEWGPVQVQVKVDNGKLTDVVVLQYPNERQRSVEINNGALPVLHDEAVAAQSASIDAVSGATVTSQGYVASLQAALDQAGVGH